MTSSPATGPHAEDVSTEHYPAAQLVLLPAQPRAPRPGTTLGPDSQLPASPRSVASNRLAYRLLFWSGLAVSIAIWWINTLGSVSGATYPANAFQLSARDAMAKAGPPT